MAGTRHLQVRLRGTAAATNFALSDYRDDLVEYHRMQQVCPPFPCPPNSVHAGRRLRSELPSVSQQTTK